MKNPFPSQVLLAAAAVFLCSAAHADLTLKMTMLSSASVVKGKKLDPHDARVRKDLLEAPGSLEATVYLSGSKIKTVSPTLVTVRDLSGTTETYLMPETKTKYTMSVLPPVSVMKQWNRKLSANIVDMNETSTFLGHKVRCFKLYTKTSSMNSTVYFWVAPDMPAPPSSDAANSVLGMFSLRKLPGMCLKASVVTVVPRYCLKTTSVYEVTAISHDPIPTSAFAIPDGYTTVSMPNLYSASQLASQKHLEKHL